MNTELCARICWMHQRPLERGRKLLLKHTTKTVQASVSAIESRMNVQSSEPELEPEQLTMNDVGQIKLRTSKPIVFDGYATNRLTGAFILIEPGTNATVGAGMLLPPSEPAKPEYE